MIVSYHEEARRSLVEIVNSELYALLNATQSAVILSHQEIALISVNLVEQLLHNEKFLKNMTVFTQKASGE